MVINNFDSRDQNCSGVLVVGSVPDLHIFECDIRYHWWGSSEHQHINITKYYRLNYRIVYKFYVTFYGKDVQNLFCLAPIKCI